MSSNNFLNAKLSFPLRKLNLQHNLRCFYTDKMTCNTNKATRSKTKKLTCSLETMKFCHSMLCATLAVPTQTFFRLRINTFLVRKILLLFHQKTALCYMLIFFHVKLKQRRLDQTEKRCVSEFLSKILSKCV